MSITEDMANNLAQETLKTIDQHGNDNIVHEIAEILGADSVTSKEAFLTAIRVHKADKRARKYLAELNN